MEGSIDRAKRRFLLGATTAVGTVGVIAFEVPYGMTFGPSERAKAAGVPVDVDISKLELGQQINVEWRRKVVWVIHRTKEMLDGLPKLDSKLADPKSGIDHQPPYAKNEYRSLKPEIFVAIAICTHLGCSPTFRPEIAPSDLSADWLARFFCPFQPSKFDLAGPSDKSVTGPTNLCISPYRFLSDT